MKSEDLNIKELEQLLRKKKKAKKKMRSGKKALFISFAICIILIAFTMVMIITGKDTSSLGILATAGVGILPVMYGIYTNASTKEKMVHMEKNYRPNYDEEEGLY